MRIDATATIDVPPAALWPWIDDPGRCKQWMKGVLDYVPDAPGPLRPGSTATMRVREGGKAAEYRLRILERVPPEHLSLEISGGSFRGMKMLVDYRLVDLGGRTRLDYSAGCETKGALRLLAPLLSLFARMQVRTFFRALKRLAEAEGRPAAAGR